MSRSRKVGFSKLLNIDDVLEKFFSYGVVHRIQAEEVPIVSSVGRVLASNLVTNIDLPPYDRSAVDGFALKAEDTLRSSESNPVSLKIVDTVEIGTTPKVPIRRLEAVRISTGAPRPVGTDAVVMIEHAEQKKDQVKIFNPISAWKNMIKKGEDVKVGDLLLEEGSDIMPQDVGMLSALSLSSIKVVRKPRVAVLSVGDELLKESSEQAYGKTVDINRPAIISSLLQDGCEPIDLGIVGDDFGIVEAKVTGALGKNDMLLVGGGTSVGSKDIVPDVLDSLGEPGIVAHGLAIKPGKPAGLAILNKKPVVLLPGYPVAALITYSIIARPIILRLLGNENIRNKDDIVNARLTRTIDSSPGIREFVRVTIRAESSGFSAEPVTASGASILSSMVRSNGIFVVPENTESITQNELVEVRLIRPLK